MIYIYLIIYFLCVVGESERRGLILNILIWWAWPVIIPIQMIYYSYFD